MRSRSGVQQSRAGFVATTLVVAMSLAGCGSYDLILSPTTGVHGEGAALPGPMPPSQATPTRNPETITIIGGTETITRTELIRASTGGVVTAGRHRLTIPPGALKDDTSIQLKDISGSAGYVACEAYPEGLTFEKPVLLETSFGDLKNPFGYTIYWIANPGKADEEWVDMTSSLSSDGSGLTAWLTHFSTYAPGKAGWTPRRGVPGHLRTDQ